MLLYVPYPNVDLSSSFQQCLKLDPNDRPSSSLLLRHNFFKEGHFEDKVLPDLRARINKENAGNLLARKEANEKKEERLAKKKKKVGECTQASYCTSSLGGNGGTRLYVFSCRAIFNWFLRIKSTTFNY